MYLTGNPQITFWKIIYRRHTNYAIESIEQTFNGTVGFGRKTSCTISRNGDLVTDVVLECSLKKNGATFYPAEAFIADVECEIGGQRVDKHYADWFRIYDNLFRRDNEREQYRRLVDFVDGEANDCVKRFYVPLVFFFNRNPGLALPLIALTAARKSIPPRASGPCARESRLDSQWPSSPCAAAAVVRC